MAAADMSWAPPLALPGRGLSPDPVHAIVLSMAEAPVVAPVDAPQMADRISSYLEQIYGMNHPDAVTDLLPAVTATYLAVTGTHDTNLVDPVFRQQLRHTLTLDGRYPTGRPDAVWDISHEWKPAPPRQPKPEAKRRRAKTIARTETTHWAIQQPRTATAKPTRLDRLAANVQAARRRQLARQASAANPGQVAIITSRRQGGMDA